MKNSLKLLSLAMLFALPLASCGDNSGTNEPGKKEEDQKEDGQPELLVNPESEAYRIVFEMFGIEKEDVVIKDGNTAEFDDEADIWFYNKDTFTYYMTGCYDEELDFEGIKAYAISLLPDKVTLNEKYTYGEDDYSEGDISYIYADYTYDDEKIAYNLVIYFYEDEEGISTALYIYILDLVNYEEYSIDWEE